MHAAVADEYIVFDRTVHVICSLFRKKTLPLLCFLRFIIVFFFPTLNNRISDISWGGKLIFFSPGPSPVSRSLYTEIIIKILTHSAYNIISYAEAYYNTRTAGNRKDRVGCGGFLWIYIPKTIFVFYLFHCAPYTCAAAG